MPAPTYRGPRSRQSLSKTPQDAVRRNNKHPSNNNPNNNNSNSCCRLRAVFPLVVTAALTALSYYGGQTFVENRRTQLPCSQDGKRTDADEVVRLRRQREGEEVHGRIDSMVKDRLAAALLKRESDNKLKQQETDKKKAAQQQKPTKRRNKNKNKTPQKDAWPTYPDSLTDILAGIATIPKTEFLQTFNYGTPSTPLSRHGTEDVLLLYHTHSSLPNTPHPSPTSPLPPRLTVADATHNCGAMNVVYTNPDPEKGHCWAMLLNYQNQHVQKWIRMEEGDGGLTAVGRGVGVDGRNSFPVPGKGMTERYGGMLKRYLDSSKGVLEELRPILERAAKNREGMEGEDKKPEFAEENEWWGGVVVMTTNYGQADLLANFVCAARGKGLGDALGNVVVFATDEKAEAVAKGLGLNVFYDKENFAHLSEKEAGAYGDDIFMDMMYAKIVSVQLVNMLGYNVLFQDVDVVWYKDPIRYLQTLQNPSNANRHYDILFQDDGNRDPRFSDAYGNSGFYYVRANPLTTYLLTSVLYDGATLFTSRSHQEVLMAKVAEHSSLFGLHVGVLDTEKFMCGAQYHMKRGAAVRDMLQEKTDPFVFHMSWTHSKVNKVLFMKQMGMWYTEEQCTGDGMLEGMLTSGGGGKYSVENYLDVCCAAEALVSCHYRDKPSIIPCKDSPPIDADVKSFW